ncbi:DsbA family protein [Streptomyces longispororuber]|uniref:DsbA family protein n=1 Tax=Streptomyces longispororuber TaxID=68230 RepID=UPI003405A0A9
MPSASATPAPSGLAAPAPSGPAPPAPSAPATPVRTLPRCYFSFRSPFSWLAWQETAARHPELAARMEWVPFFDPDPLTARLVADRGGWFPFPDRPPGDDRVWEVPHLAYLAAARLGRGPDFLQAAFRAAFTRGLDLCDRAVVARVGRELGLDPAPLADAADAPAPRADGIQALLDACADGVFSVPFFVHDHLRCFGLDRLDAFAALLPTPSPAPLSDRHQPAVSGRLRRSTA